MGRATTKAALLAVAILLTAAAHGRVPDAAPIARADVFVPRPEVARATALGFEPVIADYYWLQAVQVVGAERVADRKAVPARAADRPRDDARPVGRSSLSASPRCGSPTASTRCATPTTCSRSGIAYHPDRLAQPFLPRIQPVLLPRAAGRRAADAIEPALHLPGAPDYLGALVARLRAQGDGLDTAALFLQQLIREAADESGAPSTCRRSTRSRPSGARACSTPRARAPASATVATSRAVQT